MTQVDTWCSARTDRPPPPLSEAPKPSWLVLQAAASSPPSPETSIRKIVDLWIEFFTFTRIVALSSRKDTVPHKEAFHVPIRITLSFQIWPSIRGNPSSLADNVGSIQIGQTAFFSSQPTVIRIVRSSKSNSTNAGCTAARQLSSLRVNATTVKHGTSLPDKCCFHCL